MKERGMIFSAPMVRAIQEGRKTQTRRPIRIQPPENGYSLCTLISTTGDSRNEGRHHWCKIADDGISVLESSDKYFSAPCKPGDRLWVRETWQPHPDAGCSFPDFGTIPADAVGYAADLSDADREESKPWKPSIHMPRWASRITLEIIDVRVEQVQEIYEEGAIAEGFKFGYENGSWSSARSKFSALWHSIYAAKGQGWDDNPWVWVIEFRRVDE